MEDVVAFLRRIPWASHRAILVAASGGLDSMVLLDILHQFGREPERQLQLAAACFDHGWRGREGAKDAAFVERFCTLRGIRFFSGVASQSREPGCSSLSEALARRARYAFLAAVARREGYAVVVTAHHADDQIETLLLRMERGGREEGLAGIHAKLRIHDVPFCRPLLDVSRNALVSYAELRRLAFREDPTNRVLDHRRNRLRYFAAPHVPRGEAAYLVRIASLRRRLVEAAADRVEPFFEPEGNSSVRLPVKILRAIASDLRREVLRRAFHAVAESSAPFPERALDSLERLLLSRRGGRVDLRGVRAELSCDYLRFVMRNGAEKDVSARGSLEGDHAELFDPSEIQGRLELRAWRAGDRIYVRRGPASVETPGQSTAFDGRATISLLGRKKVKELFRELRVPTWQRAWYPVVADELGVLWVVGLRRGARALPKPGSGALRVSVRTPSPQPPGPGPDIPGDEVSPICDVELV